MYIYIYICVYTYTHIQLGKPTYLGPKTEGARPSIAFTTGGDGKPTWWVSGSSQRGDLVKGGLAIRHAFNLHIKNRT